jgi:hypothetical protein
MREISAGEDKKEFTSQSPTEQNKTVKHGPNVALAGGIASLATFFQSTATGEIPATCRSTLCLKPKSVPPIRTEVGRIRHCNILCTQKTTKTHNSLISTTQTESLDMNLRPCPEIKFH